MIKLYIENQEAAINGETFTIVRDNPLITKAGDYTLDVDLNLDCVENRIIYNRIKRFHSDVNEFNQNAVLLDKEKVLLRGTAILLKVENNVAKIQLVSNNSELNYIYDNTTRVRDMDFGVVQTRNATDAAKVSSGVYGDTIDGISVKESYPQLFKTDFSDFGGSAEILNYVGNNDGGAYSIWFKDDTPLRPQPYLLYYVDRLVELLGYTLGQCDINRDKYRRLIVVHGYDTNEYAKMLPDWTVTEFISELEKFFNVVFFVDNATKVLDIISVDKFYENVGKVYIDRDAVVDEKETEFGKEAEKVQTSYKNVGYKLPSSEYWQFESIDEKVYAISAKRNAIFANDYEDNDPAKYEILKDREKDVEWVHYENSEGKNKHARLVNQFAPVVMDERVDRTELKISPAKILASYRVGDHGSYTFLAPIPVFYENNAGTFSNAIRNGVADTAGDILQVAFYLGFCEYDNLSYGATMCVTTRWHQLFSAIIENVRYSTPGVNKETTLSLNGQYGRCATELLNSIMLDTTKLYTLKIKSEEWMDPRAIFVIDNRALICRKFEYEFSNHSISPILKGEFYAMKEAEKSEPVPVDEVESTYNNIAAAELSGKIIFFNYDLENTDVVMEGTNGSLSKNYLIEHIKSGQENQSPNVVIHKPVLGHAEMIGLFNEVSSSDITWVRIYQFKNRQLQYDSDETNVYREYFEESKYRGGFMIFQDGIRYILFDDINPGERYDFIMHATDRNGRQIKMRVGFGITE